VLAARGAPYRLPGQEAFLEGHVAAFEVLGGIPPDKIRYDNPRSAVHRVLFGRNRADSGRYIDGRAMSVGAAVAAERHCWHRYRASGSTPRCR
jgi:transposase